MACYTVSGPVAALVSCRITSKDEALSTSYRTSLSRVSSRAPFVRLRMPRHLTNALLSSFPEVPHVFNGRPSEAKDRIKISLARSSQAPGDLITEGANAEDPETCEIVQGSNVVLGDGEDRFQGYLIQAIKNNNGSAILCLTDVLGFENGDSRDFAYRLACFGYNVLVPDLFRGDPWYKGRPEGFEVWREQHSPDRVAGDIDVASKYLLEEVSSTGKLGVLGFCFGGGRLIETLARDSDNVFVAGAFLYGTRFDSSLATQIKAPVLLITGDRDDSCTPDVVRKVEQQAKGSKVKIYPGFGHGFAHHPNSSEEDEAAEDAFTEVRHWFHDLVLDDNESDSKAE